MKKNICISLECSEWMCTEKHPIWPYILAAFICPLIFVVLPPLKYLILTKKI